MQVPPTERVLWVRLVITSPPAVQSLSQEKQKCYFIVRALRLRRMRNPVIQSIKWCNSIVMVWKLSWLTFTLSSLHTTRESVYQNYRELWHLWTSPLKNHFWLKQYRVSYVKNLTHVKGAEFCRIQMYDEMFSVWMFLYGEFSTFI